jgi:two-component sensor histidine kinase
VINKLLNIGVGENVDFYQKRETRALNLFGAVTIVGGIAGAVYNFILGEVNPTIIILLEIIASLSVIILNRKKLYQAAVFTFIISKNLTLFYINVYYDDRAGIYLYYFPFIFCIALLHNPNKGKSRDLFFFGLALLSFICSKISFFQVFEKTKLSENHVEGVFSFNIYLAIFLTALLVLVVIRTITKQYLELTDLLKQTQIDKQTIQSSLSEKEVLLAEIQHRVKNNLSVLIGLFNLQSNNTENQETRDALLEARNRVMSIAMVHEKLYKKDNLSQINLKHYLSELSREIIKSHPLACKVKIEESLDEILADITKAVPIGLIVNETVTNSLKHGFKNLDIEPIIKVSLTTYFGEVSIKLSDNGIGFSEDQARSDKTLGLSLIESLADQIDGKVHFSNKKGAVVKLTLPI